MNAGITLATALRVLQQLRRDPRTIALLLVVPVVLVALINWIYASNETAFQRVGVGLLGLFPLISMFVVTSIAVLRERTSGTLERLMTTPMAKLDLLAGYGLAFGLLAIVQASLVAAVAILLLGLDIEGSTGGVIGLAILNAELGMALGLFLSAFARSEFQAVQFMPGFIAPQMLVSGLLGPRDQMARGLEIVSDFLPLTYAYEGLARAGRGEPLEGRFVLDVGVTVGVTLLALALGAATLPRRTE